jgi:hypothetical protein
MNKDLETRCCVCKRIKIEGIWHDYPVDPSNSEVSHGICPDCLIVTYPEYAYLATIAPSC